MGIMENKSTGRVYDSQETKKIALRVSTTSIVVNILLTFMKLVAGIIARSGAMISDAVHSASDVFSTIIVIIGVNISSKNSDTDHQYGHERMECVAAILLSIALAAVGIGIGYTGITKIVSGGDSLKAPGMLALIAAVVSVAVKEWMYWYTRGAAKRTNSGVLMADAWHHRSDALSSIGAFAGILGSRMGYPVLDPVASLIICVFIEKVAYDVFKDAMDKMVDKSCTDDVVEKMRVVISEQAGVERIDDIKTRLFGAKIYVDVEIAADGNKTLSEGHEIAEEVHKAIERNFPEVKHCMVHINPVTVQEEGK